MKMHRKILLMAMTAAAAFGPGPLTTQARQEVSASVEIHATADFYAPLTPVGTWVEVGSYGRCWRPAGVAVGWRPYCNGAWVWTDCGWYWQTDEPWGWACYHYGSWVMDPGFGWVWVPGVEWSPAWVEWRVGGGYIGWAPCAPHGVIVAAPLFAFVEVGHFHEPIRPGLVVINNTTIINRTTVMSDVKRESRTIGGRTQTVVVNHGPDVAMVEKATGKHMTATPVQEVAQHTPMPGKLRPAGARSPTAAEHKTPANATEKGTVHSGKSDRGDKPDQPDSDNPDKGDGGVSKDKPDSGTPGHSGGEGRGKGGKGHGGRGGGNP